MVLKSQDDEDDKKNTNVFIVLKEMRYFSCKTIVFYDEI